MTDKIFFNATLLNNLFRSLTFFSSSFIYNISTSERQSLTEHKKDQTFNSFFLLINKWSEWFPCTRAPLLQVALLRQPEDFAHVSQKQGKTEDIHFWTAGSAASPVSMATRKLIWKESGAAQGEPVLLCGLLDPDAQSSVSQSSVERVLGGAVLLGRPLSLVVAAGRRGWDPQEGGQLHGQEDGEKLFHFCCQTKEDPPHI